MQEIVMCSNRRREKLPTLWPMGAMEMFASFAERLRRAQAFDRGPVNEATEAQIEEGAKLDELVHAHLALSVQDVPQPLSVHTDAASKLGNTYSAFFPNKLNFSYNASEKILLLGV